MKLSLIFTTFPVATETFLQREVRGLRRLGVELELNSLWGGADEWEGLPVRRFSLWHLVGLLWWMPYWMLRRPAVLRDTAERLFGQGIPGILNFGENLLGMGFALIHARRLEKAADWQLHAVWATTPGAAAWLVHRLSGKPFSLAAHAYDLFEHGGDGLLREKLAEADWVRSSTAAGVERLRALGCPAEKILRLGRGLDTLPPQKSIRPRREPLQILSVGRLVEKMGYSQQLEIYAAAQRAGLEFEVRIVGDGALAGPLRQQARRLGIEERVHFLGAQPYAAVEEGLAWADVFVFSGCVSRSGDRAGFPNALAEAMAWGVPVLSSRVGGVAEVIEHDHNGLLLESADPVASLSRLQIDKDLCQRLTRQARKWIESCFTIDLTMQQFIEQMRKKTESRKNIAQRLPLTRVTLTSEGQF